MPKPEFLVTLSGPQPDTQEAEETTFSMIVGWLFEQNLDAEGNIKEREDIMGILVPVTCP